MTIFFIASALISIIPVASVYYAKSMLMSKAQLFLIFIFIFIFTVSVYSLDGHYPAWTADEFPIMLKKNDNEALSYQVQIALNPQNQDFFYALANSYIAQKEFNQAYLVYSAFVHKFGKTPELIAHWTNALILHGQYSNSQKQRARK